jgi:hypothetical protein
VIAEFSSPDIIRCAVRLYVEEGEGRAGDARGVSAKPAISSSPRAKERKKERVGRSELREKVLYPRGLGGLPVRDLRQEQFSLG